ISGCSGDLLPPSPPAEKPTARQDQAGKSSTGDGTGHNCYRANSKDENNHFRDRSERAVSFPSLQLDGGAGLLSPARRSDLRARRACGAADFVEAHSSMAPGMVAMPGRMALMISTSGSAEFSSLSQNASSSIRPATTV